MNKEEFINYVREKRVICPQYPHFDRACTIESCIDKITNKDYVKGHSFFPLIHKKIKFKRVKRDKLTGELIPNDKEREISYASHFDSWIYLYYSVLFNEKYNDYCKTNFLDDVSVAYRNNLGKSNIDFAKDAFDFIEKLGECYVIVSDFSKYFDKIDHKYLKNQLKKILNENELSEDEYNVWKNICRYSSIEYSDLKKCKRTKEQIKNKQLIPMSEVRNNRINIHSNTDKGIPQGLSISAVLANINMATIDVKINKFIKSIGGKYVRYSDDSIFIFPTAYDVEQKFKDILDMFNEAKSVEISIEKTRKFHVSDKKVYLITENQEKEYRLDYLGFIYENGNVRLRDKTIYKYNYRLKKKINGHKNKIMYSAIENGTLYSKESCKFNKSRIYNTYSSHIDSENVKSKNVKKHGNYYSYIKRCMKVFPRSKSIRKAYFHNLRKIKMMIKMIHNTENK